MIRFFLLISLMLASAMGQCSGIDWSWFKKNVLDRIEISGSRTFGYHSHSVVGDREAFNSLNYYGYGARQWTDVGNMSFTGRRVLGVANFQATVDTNRFSDPNAERVSIDYEKKPYAIHLGDIQGSMLNTNRFASFQKTLKGVSVEYGKGRFRSKAVYSEAKGSPRTISFTGNNTSGPYYLNASQIVPGSEQVEVDGQHMTLVQDYTIRYEYGELAFVNRVISPTSTIVVSFEAYGFNTNKGTVQGLGASYSLGKFGTVGVTAMRQLSKSDGVLSTRSELFQGAGAASTPYFLQFEPLRSRPIRVLLNGVEQTETLHYYFDSGNPTIFFFTFFVSTTSTIEVIYTPTPTSTVDGDREVLGIDYSYRIGAGAAGVEAPGSHQKIRKPAGGELRLYGANGKLKNEINPMSGTAKGIDVRYDWGNFRFRANAKDVPSTFVGIESRGFNRNERGVDGSLSFVSEGFTAELSGGSSDVTTQRVNSSGETIFSTAELQRLGAALTYNKVVGEPWRLDFNHLESTTTSGETRLDSASLSTSRFIGDVQMRFALDAQQGRAPLTLTSGTVPTDIALNSFKIESTYNPNTQWSLGLRAGLSNVRAGDDSGTGQDYVLVATYQPSNRLSANLTFAKSDAGEVALLAGLQTGWGLGYNGNGFSGGVGSGFEVGVTNANILSFRSNYEATENLSLFFLAEQNETTGSYSSNSETQRFDIGVDWGIDEKTRIGMSLNTASTKFNDSPLASNSTSLSAHLVARPGKRWSISAAASYLLTGGTSEFSQDNLSWDMLVSYALSDRQRLGAAYRFGRTTGYLPQVDDAFELSYGYKIWQNVSLIGSYKYRNVANSDGNPSGAYRSSGIDIELRFGF